MIYPIEPRDDIGYAILSFAKIMGKGLRKCQQHLHLKLHQID